MKFVSSSLAIASILLWSSPIFAQALPEKTKQLLQKLEQFEANKHAALEAELKQKRSEISALLKSHAKEQLVESKEALSIQAAIEALNVIETGSRFKISSIKIPKASMKAVNADQHIELLLERLNVTCLRQGLLPLVNNKFLIKVELDGKSIYEANKEGVHLVIIGESDKVITSHFGNVTSSKKATKEAREKLIDALNNISEEKVVIFCKAGACRPLTNDDKTDQVLQILGGKTRKIGFRQPYVCMGYKGLRKGDAIEVIGGDETMAILRPPEK